MSRVIDLSAHGRGRGPSEPIRHPAGVILPFEGPSDAALIIPELRSEIRAGAYDADMIALIDAAVRPGDRVLVIGAGLGVISTLIARREGVERVIAVEANTALIPYLERTHALNGVEGVETINAVLAEGKKGRVPFFARRDLRNSSLLPHDRSWQQVMMVPYMDLNLILTEERITLVVSDIPTASASLLARAELGPVERILLSYADDPSGAWEDDGVCARLVARGYVPEAAGTAVLLRRADLLRVPGDKDAPAGEGRAEEGRSGEGRPEDTHPEEALPEEALPEEALPEVGEDTDEDDTDGDRAVNASGVESPAEAGGGRAPSPSAAGPVAGLPGEAGADAAPHGGPDAGRDATPEVPPQSAAQIPPEVARKAPREVAAPELPPTPNEPLGAARGAGRGEPRSGGDRPEARAPGGAPEPESGRRRRLWGPVAVALALALPLMLIGQLAGERGGARMAAMEEIGAAWGGPQTLTGPFLVVPVRGTDGGAAEPLIILPQSLEAATALVTDGGRAGTRGAPAGREYGALVYRSRSEVRLVADAASAAALVAPGETALWQESRLALGISEPNALGAAYFLSGTAQGGAAAGTAGDGGFVAGTGAGGLPGIQAAVGDPRGREAGWRFVLELDGWRLLRLTPAGGTTSWRMHADWPHPAFRGPFRPALEETGERGFIAHWQVPEAAVALPRAFRGTGPFARLDALAIGVELAPPLDLYRTIERGAKLGLMVIALTFGAVLLLERSSGRTGRVVHYALIGAAQCAFFLLLLPLAERLGFQAAYAIAAAATTVLLTIYAWSALGLGSRAGWVALALAALYGVMYPILAAREHTLLMGAVLAFLIVAALMWATRGGRGEGGEGAGGA